MRLRRNISRLTAIRITFAGIVGYLLCRHYIAQIASFIDGHALGASTVDFFVNGYAADLFAAIALLGAYLWATAGAEAR